MERVSLVKFSWSNIVLVEQIGISNTVGVLNPQSTFCQNTHLDPLFIKGEEDQKRKGKVSVLDKYRACFW